MMSRRGARRRANKFKAYRGVVLEAIASHLGVPMEMVMKDLKTPGDGRAPAIHRAHTQGQPEDVQKGAPPKPEDRQKALREGYDAEVARQEKAKRDAEEAADRRRAEQNRGI